MEVVKYLCAIQYKYNACHICNLNILIATLKMKNDTGEFNFKNVFYLTHYIQNIII